MNDMKQEAVAYIALGANLGDRERSLREAIARLDAHPAVRVAACSDIYETEPVGYTDQPQFLNMAARVASTLAPQNLLRVMLDIELEMGRVRDIRWGPRVIDLDLLYMEGFEMDSPELTLPHPRMGERLFVLIPLADVVSSDNSQLHAFVHRALGTLDGKEDIRKWTHSNWPDESAPSAN
ncbi:2-amino-4-hydroxy-6-hydroxymethyldihydropteridine diphosphokinase [Paenibacillus thiaminolyticus]|uniref:2-amino-4-hydroxy-6- hydroxymethyldihydropteridine diphosphokinase n=1 Tax=Paenibacillus thiaminolyticus TaxID=49283 RepID=UPI002542F613|nr:2-amino-4-hydroxy-6-hydroxymethyldihydropteridine diphosphokinase [Paenibacillus thiaminolyticus]WII37702.1 2-amino-4-hydroxy-6-hydroxymethyldihydropteridine diphosphokinase [Paenibacillus thiaminolyticus]